MKVAVYAIAKNEAHHILDWVNSMCEADELYVLDTGSTDGTPDILRKLGVHVAVQVNEPFRFDRARNVSLAMIPPHIDWCVCTDLDERFSKGWRKVLEDTVEAHRDKGLNSVVCRFITAFDKDGRPVNSMDYWKIHRRGSCHWVAPVHEYLEWDEPRVMVFAEGMLLEHHPDDKPRDYYLPMLEAAVKEERNPRNLFYYGRELMFHNRPAAAVAVLMEYLMHPCATWNGERAWAMRFIARCLYIQNEGNLAVHWYVMASQEAPDQRESLVEYARMCAEIGEYAEAIRALGLALERKERPRIFFTEDDCWDGTPERLVVEYSEKLKEAQDEHTTGS